VIPLLLTLLLADAVPGIAAPSVVSAAVVASSAERIERLPQPTTPAAVRDTDVTVVLGHVNEERIRHGRHPLRLDPLLCAFALSTAEDMAVRGYFGHETPDGVSFDERLRRGGVRYTWAGENLAFDESAAAASKRLWESPPHRDNILEPHFVRVGIAAIATPAGELVVEEFSN
jgi:uncharacterized protein YkwD